MSKSFYINKLREKFTTNKEFDLYQQRIIIEGNRAIHEEDLSSWSELDWFVWDNNIQEIY